MENAANRIALTGALDTLPEYSHTNHDRKFYRLMLAVERLSGAVDLLSALVRRLQKRTGIYFTVHMLRHSSLSELRRLGWPVEQLRIRAGHHFVQSTYVYLHADDEEMRQEWIRTENQMLLRKGSTKNESGL